MPFHLGDTKLTNLKIGDANIVRAYLGGVEVYPAGPVSSVFDMTRNTAYDLNVGNHEEVNGMWFDGTNLWVMRRSSRNGVNSVDVYNARTGVRDATKSFALPGVYSGSRCVGPWSDGSTMYCYQNNHFDAQGDFVGSGILAFDISSGIPTTHTRTALSGSPFIAATANGFWSNGTEVWIPFGRDAIHSYNLSDGTRNTDRTATGFQRSSRAEIHGIWSDEFTIWVAVGGERGITTASIEAVDYQTFASKSSLDWDSGEIDVWPNRRTDPQLVPGAMTAGKLATDGSDIMFVLHSGTTRTRFPAVLNQVYAFN